MPGTARVARWSITAAWAPKLVLRTSDVPNWSAAHAMRWAAVALDSPRSAAAGSTARMSFSAVAIDLIGAAADTDTPRVGRHCLCGDLFHPVGRVTLQYTAPFYKPRSLDSCHSWRRSRARRPRSDALCNCLLR